jgi:hypothetical protein
VIAKVEDAATDISLVALEEQVDTDMLVAAIELATRPQTRTFVCHVLGTRADVAALPTLLEPLDDEDANVHATAADSIGGVACAAAGSRRMSRSVAP